MARPNIEAERARMGMTKGQMCEALGVTSKTYISYIEGGNIPSSALEKLRAALEGGEKDTATTAERRDNSG